tara:strand:- start:152 stop:289 length:138 start_codon:yes stop_codon:yes gene_type:complete
MCFNPLAGQAFEKTARKTSGWMRLDQPPAPQLLGVPLTLGQAIFG